MKHRVLLIHAPTADSELLFRGAPMSLLYATAVLCEKIGRGCYPPLSRADVRLFDPALTCVREPERAVKEVARVLREDKPLLVGIGTTSYAFIWALRIAAEVKAWNPSCTVVLGGPHEDEGGATLPGGSVAAHGDVIDFSVQGDGEHLFDRLFERLHRHRFCAEAVKKSLAEDTAALVGVEGSGAIAFRYSGKAHSIAIGGRFKPGLIMRARRPLDLDSLPVPPRWLLSEAHKYLFDVFRHPGGRGLKATAQMLTTRGCRFACSFCTERGAVSYRSVASVMDELHDLKGAGYEAVFFDDSTFHQYQHLSDLLDELAARRDELKFDFGCLTRADSIVDSEPWLPLSRFEEAGFTYFYLGIEHDDDAVLREMRKGYDRMKLHACLDRFRGACRFRLGVSLLFGFQSESEETCQRSLRLVAEHPAIILANLSIVAYHPAATFLRGSRAAVQYDVPEPNREPEWDLFEEGRWYHPEHITLEYARKIHRLVCEIDAETGGRLIPKLKRAGNVIGPHRAASARVPEEWRARQLEPDCLRARGEATPSSRHAKR